MDDPDLERTVVDDPDAASETELLYVTLDAWHPGCWGIESTDRVGNGLVGHGAAVSGSSGYERCTVYGDSTEHVAQAVDAARESPFIEAIEPLGDRTRDTDGRARSPPSAIGRSARDVFIEYDATEGIGSAFLSRGFVLDGTYRVVDGIETWDLLVRTTRRSLERSLDEIRAERDADISVERVSPSPPSRPATGTPTDADRQRLTARQREAFALARRRGYYEWPRAVSARELAAELDVSKSTFLEHLRTAEATLLGE